MLPLRAGFLPRLRLIKVASYQDMARRSPTPSSRPAGSGPVLDGSGLADLGGDPDLLEYPGVTRVRRRKATVSPIGAFFLGLLSQAVLLAALAAAFLLYPEKARRLVSKSGFDWPWPDAVAAFVAGPSPGNAGTAEIERIHILRLEDRALSRGDRTAWKELGAKLNQLDRASADFDGVQASLFRIRMGFQQRGQEIPPPLDPREIFPTAATENEIPLASLIQVLLDQTQNEVRRQRAAWLLADAPAASARNALYQAIQEDPNLFVVAQAFHSFRSLTGYPGQDGFDDEALARWWSRNAPGVIGQK